MASTTLSIGDYCKGKVVVGTNIEDIIGKVIDGVNVNIVTLEFRIRDNSKLYRMSFDQDTLVKLTPEQVMIHKLSS